MRKHLFLTLLAVMMTVSTSAQSQRSDWTLNTRAWSTNYFTTMIGAVASVVITDVILDSDDIDSLTVDRIIPMPSIVFPIGLQKEGFQDPYDIYGPYHRAFGNPFKHIGDYAVGIDASWQPSVIGLYAGAYFKSQEIVYKETDDNLRGFYLQPRAGLVIGGKNVSLEAGAFYDIATGCRGTGALSHADKSALENGIGLDFAFSWFDKNDRSSTTLQLSMPLHNMLNDYHHDNPGTPAAKRRVGYIMITNRIAF